MYLLVVETATSNEGDQVEVVDTAAGEEDNSGGEEVTMVTGAHGTREGTPEEVEDNGGEEEVEEHQRLVSCCCSFVVINYSSFSRGVPKTTPHSNNHH